jgi:phenylalanyl-tRNA synthetase beta chain
LHWKYKPSKADFYQLKGYVQGIIFSLGNMEQQAIESDSPFLVNSEAQVILTQDKKIAEFGKLHPAVAAKFGIDTVELKQDIWIADLDLSELLDQSRDYQPVYTTIARYPSVERDISFLIRQEAAYAEIIDQFTMSAQAVFSSACLIDEYRGKQVPDGFRSLTFRLVFNSVEKTLTDDEVEAALASIINNLKSQWDIQLR